MSKSGEEVEFKFLVEGPEAFQALAATLGGVAAGAPVRQVNHFFDTSVFDLADAELAVRLREEAGRWILTAKGPTEGADETIAIRPEVETEVPEARALTVLEGEESPLQLLRELVGEHALFTAMDSARGGRTLRRIGSFENVRSRLGPVPLTIGGDSWQATFELDRTLFPGNRTDHEIEVEVDGRARADAAKKVLCGLLEKANIAWQPGSSKARRFLATLRG